MNKLILALALVAPSAAFGQQSVNPIHPPFAPLAADGRPAHASSDVDADRTCGACHDAKFVTAHSNHAEGRSRATCIECHVDGGKLDLGALGPDGKLVREALRIGTPRSGNCSVCHGLIAPPNAPVSLPSALQEVPSGGRTWSLTLGGGAIISAQRMRDSFLNIEDKETLSSPWDVHAAKLVECIACHHAGNNPARVDAKKAKLSYVSSDPRRTSTAEFLVRPDHRLAALDCRACHDANKAHAFLPYRERHVQVIACQTCHLQGQLVPAAEMIDETVVTLEGRPGMSLRNSSWIPGEPLNAAGVTPLRPLLVMRQTPDGARRLTPVNLVSRWRWTSQGEPVPFETVRKAWLEGGGYAPEVLAALDADRDGRLSAKELRLEGEGAVGAIAARLRALGVADPRIEGVLEPHVLAHGIPSHERALRDCTACHASDSRVAATFPLASYVPGGVPPRPPEGLRVELQGIVEPGTGGGLVFRQGAGTTPSGLHVLGHTRASWSNLLGFLLFVAVALGVSAHGVARVVMHRRRGGQVARAAHAADAGPKQEYVFGQYERFWHWTMALSGITLIATGLVVHNAGSSLGLASATWLHNAAAFVLMVNAFLGLFYHGVTAAIRHFIPTPHGFLKRIIEHMEYQARGIFYGGPHPENAPGHKLNPLQQLTYLALLNLLFPFQIATGIAIWAIGHWPSLGDAVGGLAVLAPLHNLGSWLFMTFFVLHVYLVTTGRTVGEHLRSMVTGYRALDPEPPSAPAPSQGG